MIFSFLKIVQLSSQINGPSLESKKVFSLFWSLEQFFLPVNIKQTHQSQKDDTKAKSKKLRAHACNTTDEPGYKTAP